MLQIQNTYTNTTGRAKIDRVVSAQVWREEILPAMERVLGPSPRRAFARVGLWIVEAQGDDEHIHDFFSRNWKMAEPQAPQIRSYFISHCSDPAELRVMLGLQNDAELEDYRKNVLESLRDERFRATLCDPRFGKMEHAPREEQIQTALAAPAVVYCPELFSALSLNTNYYGQFKSKCVLGPLEEFLVRQGRPGDDGKLVNPEEVWVSLHSSAVEYATEKAGSRTVIMVGPTGGGKSTHAYGLIKAKQRNMLHSDDWLFVNAGSRELLRAEENFYMRTPMARFYPELGSLFLSHPLENLPENKIDTLNEEIQKLKQNQSTRVLMDPKKLANAHGILERGAASDLIIIKRDYRDPVVIRKISGDEMVAVLTSPENVCQYTPCRTDDQGREILQLKTTEVYYNPYLCVSELLRDGRAGELDALRIAALKSLAASDGIETAQFNARLPVPQAQFCLRLYLEGGIEKIRVEDKRGTMVLEFFRAGGKQEWLALNFRDPEHVEIEAWSEGETANFFKRYEALGVHTLFSPHI